MRRWDHVFHVKQEASMHLIETAALATVAHFGPDVGSAIVIASPLLICVALMALVFCAAHATEQVRR